MITTLGAGLTNYLTRYELSTTTNLFVSSGVGLATAMTLGAIDLAKGNKPAPAAVPAAPVGGPAPYPGPGTPYGGGPGTPYGGGPATPYGGGPGAPYGGAPPAVRRSRAGLVISALVLLLLCAGGGYGLTQGVQWAADKLSTSRRRPG